MKKIIPKFFASLLVVLLVATFASCSTENEQSDDFSIVSTIFAPYDWVKQILGENIGNYSLSFLTDTGVDLHNFQPSVSDIARISTSDMFIYVGGHSDAWVEDVLRNATNPNMIVINLMEVLGLEGHHYCDHDHNHHHDHDHNHHHDHDHDIENDEHIWLSLKFAQVLVYVIADALVQLSPANAAQYQANRDAYMAELADLDAQYRAMVYAAPGNKILVADRFPFAHLVSDYGIYYYAAFPGCHAETEASFTTVAFLIDRVNEHSMRSILVTEGSDQALARTIARDANHTPQILVLDSMQSISQSDVQGGITYLGIMQANLAVLREALS